MPHSADRVVVIGGGVAGASTALALQRSGIDVAVFERSPEPRDPADALQIWVNGMLALDRLGLGDEIRARSEPMTTQELRSWRGRILQRVDVAGLASERGLPQPFIVRRSDLLTALTNGLDDGVLTRSSSCVGIEQDADGVTVRLADGREERAAVAVVADGMTSEVRNAVFGRIEPRYAGYRYLSAVSEHQDASVPPGAFQFILGPGDRFGIHAGHRWSLWFAALVGPPGDGEAREPKKQTLKERFRRFGGAVEGFIDGTDETAIEATDVEDLDPLERWVSGRVVLIGDAAHASTPNLGRGGGDALEDGIVLANCLADAAGDVTNALARFEQRRRENASDVQKRARRIGKLNSWKNPLAVAVRERIMRLASGATVKEIKTDFARFAAIADDSCAPDARVAG